MDIDWEDLATAKTALHEVIQESIGVNGTIDCLIYIDKKTFVKGGEYLIDLKLYYGDDQNVSRHRMQVRVICEDIRAFEGLLEYWNKSN